MTSSEATCPGVIMRVGGTLRFLPIEMVRQIAPETPTSQVPGAGIGIALVSDQVVAVIRLGPPTGHLLVCDMEGEPVSLAGVEVLEVGHFPAAENGVRYADALAPEFDISEQLARLVSASPAYGSGKKEME